MIETLINQFHFEQPLFLLLIIPAVLFSYYRFKVTSSYNEINLEGNIAAHLSKYLTVKNDKARFYSPILLILLCLLLVIITLSRPVWRYDNTNAPLSPLIIVMDESVTMSQEDIKPSRYERSQIIVQGLLKNNLNRSVVVLAMSGSSHVLLPKTNDFELASLYVSYLSPDVMPVDGGNGKALINQLEQLPKAQRSSTTVLFLTDGIKSGASLMKDYFKKNNISLITIYFNAQAQNLAGSLGSKSNFNGNKVNTNDLVKSITTSSNLANKSSALYKDESSIFILLIALIILFWFRKGWALHWKIAVVLLSVQPIENTYANSLDWLLTKNQQGMMYLYLKDYKQAEEAFIDPNWKAVSCYYQERFQCAQDEFEKVGNLDGLFNMANSAAQDGRYKTAQSLYQMLNKINPNNADVNHNLAIVTKIINEINALSKNQSDEKPPTIKKRSVAEKNKINEIADGAKKKEFGEVDLITMKATDVLKSNSATEKWLRDISRDPRDFIRLKFLAEYNKEAR